MNPGSVLFGLFEYENKIRSKKTPLLSLGFSFIQAAEHWKCCENFCNAGNNSHNMHPDSIKNIRKIKNCVRHFKHRSTEILLVYCIPLTFSVTGHQWLPAFKAEVLKLATPHPRLQFNQRQIFPSFSKHCIWIYIYIFCSLKRWKY